MKERTLVLIKPNAIRRKLVGEILSRYEMKGFEITALKVLTLDEKLADQLYGEHIGRDYYPPFKEFIMSGPIIAAIIEGESAIGQVRKLNGATNPLEAAAGTIRGDYGTITRYNLVHGSDGPENAEKEIGILFPDRK